VADLEIGNPKTALNLMTVPSPETPCRLEYLLVDDAWSLRR